MKKSFTLFVALLSGVASLAQNPPIYIAFLWHMHQPNYFPYEPITQTINNNPYNFNLGEVFSSRTGPYTSWPADAVQKGINAGFDHFGSQVSFSGTLIDNLNNLESAGMGFSNWKSHWNNSINQQTLLGNPRMDMIGFGFFHSLMPLTSREDISYQIDLHKDIMANNFVGSYSKGIFPPENAFDERIIPALVEQDLEWVLVDNIHFDRYCEGYPFNTGGNLYEPNAAGQINPNPNDWVQLNNLWAPTQNSALWGRQPHYAQFTNPETGETEKIIVVPTDRYLGNQDGQGGFGALLYETVLAQLEPYNTDAAHPMLVVLHHDGDNYGGGSPSYYQNNFDLFVEWLEANPDRFVCTTIQDYLDMFPPDEDDVISVEAGSWSGADNGDPEFKKWNSDYTDCLSHDRNSWATVTAAKNYVDLARSISPNNPNVEEAAVRLMLSQASDYWYWDGSQDGLWDSHPTRAANQAIELTESLIDNATDNQPPTIWQPQRQPYNPGANEWNQLQSSDFTVFTYAFDVSGIETAVLKYRVDNDGENPLSSTANEVYAESGEVGAWQTLNMVPALIGSTTNPQPLAKAAEYHATIAGLGNVLIDYYVEVTDSLGHTAKSDIAHVWVGPQNELPHVWQNCDGWEGEIVGGGGSGGSGNPNITWTPAQPTTGEPITITVANAQQGAKLHWGINGWQTVPSAYWPSGSYLFNGSGPAIESWFNGPEDNTLTLTVGPFENNDVSVLDFVVHYNDDTWDNNNGADYHIPVSQPLTADNAALTKPGLFPNPTNGEITVVNPGKFYTSLILTDLTGRVLMQQNLQAQDERISMALTELAAGVYLFVFQSAKGQRTLKLQVSR